jgi:hypothetical protein
MEDAEELEDAIDDDDLADEALDCDELTDDSDELPGPDPAAALELELNASLPPPPHAATDKLTTSRTDIMRIFISVTAQCQIRLLMYRPMARCANCRGTKTGGRTLLILRHTLMNYYGV